VIVSVVEPAPLSEAGLNEAVAPDGNPVVPKLSPELGPLGAANVTVYCALPPAETLWLPGETESENVCTLSVMLAVCTRRPLVPATVSA
jgi:hypothetical protein